MSFRLDINALRALAVTLVVLFHFGVPGFDGGFVGVDIFFVISGYLMTKIVMTGLERGTFSYLNFVIARVVRIWPALVVMVMALLALGALFLPPMDYEALGRQAQAALMFDANRYYRSGSAGYFVSGPDERWLLHAWSLAVEWQFYLLYPVLLWASFKFHALLTTRLRWVRARRVSTARQWAFVSLLGVSVLSLIVCWHKTSGDPIGAFFSLAPRVWEMAAGGFVYLAEPFLAAWLSRWGTSWRWAGLVLLALAMYGGWAWGWEQRWPGVLALAPVVGAMLVLAAGAGGRSSPAWMGASMVQRLGLWSYSLYLWHWPVHVLNNFLEWPAAWAPWVAVLAVLVSLVLGWASYEFVETRFKYKTHQSWWRTGCALPATGVVILLAFATTVVMSHGWMGRVGEDVAFYEKRIALMKPLDYPAFCHNYKLAKQDFRMCSLNTTTPGPRVLLIGDSHAEHLFPWFAANASRRVDIFTGGGCPIVIGFNRFDTVFHCADQSRAALALAASSRYDTVIIAGNMGEFDRSPSAFCHVEGRACTKNDAPASRGDLVRSNAGAWNRILAMGKRLVIVNQVPMAPTAVAKNEMRRHFLGLPLYATYVERRPPGATRARYLDDVMALLPSHPEFFLINFREEFCVGDVCRPDDPATGLPVFFDHSHFTPEWIRAHGEALRAHVNVESVGFRR
jgi:peptidoglycan/LPS O-acetylase OafA/YrhL